MSAREMAAGPEGFTLVETLVAMVLTAVIVTALVPPMLFVAQQQRVLGSEAVRGAALEAEANRVTALSFDELDELDGQCLPYDDGRYPFTRCYTVVDISSRQREVTIVMTPSNPAIEPDTVVVRRALPSERNPFREGVS